MMINMTSKVNKGQIKLLLWILCYTISQRMITSWHLAHVVMNNSCTCFELNYCSLGQMIKSEYWNFRKGSQQEFYDYVTSKILNVVGNLIVIMWSSILSLLSSFI